MGLDVYAASRDALLARITQILVSDERFVAAWLTGSLGRNEADALSDIDLTVVVGEQYSQALCVRPAQVSTPIPKDRLDLFCLFGEPSVIYENHNNAPKESTFTFVLYQNSALMVDWTLVPQPQAKRPYVSRLLFDKVGLAISPPPEPESLDQRVKNASETVAFFWMMAAVIVKYIVRGDEVFVVRWLEHLHQMTQEVERLLAGKAWEYQRGSLSMLMPTPERQIEALTQLCNHMLDLMPEISKLGGTVPISPMRTIETLLNLRNE